LTTRRTASRAPKAASASGSGDNGSLNGMMLAPSASAARKP
jgi:hypothetical protein